MPSHQVDGCRYITFESFDGVFHAAIGRRGGFSPAPWSSLNLGGMVGDEPRRVKENINQVCLALRRDPRSIYDVWQVHGNRVVCTEVPRHPEQGHLQADAILTNSPGVTLLMRFADCVPILLWDPGKNVVGLVHAGWGGTVKQVAGEAIRTMEMHYRSHPEEIRAVIGPSIAAHHYPVGGEVVNQVRAAFGEEANKLLKEKENENRVEFDLWAANEMILRSAGVRQVVVSGICTACHLEDWYSHRAEAGKTGRFGVLIGLA